MAKQLSPFTVQVVEALTQAYPNTPTGTYGSVWHYRFWGLPGQKFDRVAMQAELCPKDVEPNWSNPQRFVQCFVNRESGDLHYAAGWAAPAKWKDGPAVEWHAAECADYAQFVKDGRGGYKGQREAWEAAQQEVSA